MARFSRRFERAGSKGKWRVPAAVPSNHCSSLSGIVVLGLWWQVVVAAAGVLVVEGRVEAIVVVVEAVVGKY